MSKWIISCPRCRADLYTTNVEPISGQAPLSKDFTHMDGVPVHHHEAMGCYKCGKFFGPGVIIPGRDTREVEDGTE